MCARLSFTISCGALTCSWRVLLIRAAHTFFDYLFSENGLVGLKDGKEIHRRVRWVLARGSLLLRLRPAPAF